MTDLNNPPKKPQYQQWDKDVDYRVRQKSKPNPQKKYWQTIIIVLLLITICAGLAIIIVQASRIVSLQEDRLNLESTIRANQTQQVDFQSTIEVLEIWLTSTPTSTPTP
jgi:hypothetical protein